MFEENRQNFLIILGSVYEEYGFSPICGWIEALLGLEDIDLSQGEISYKLSHFMKDQGVGTSVSSINRALKVLLPYGSVIRKGSAKKGYTYDLNTNPEFFDVFIQTFVKINKKAIKSLKKLKESTIKEKDQQLIKAIENETSYMEFMDQYLTESKKLLNKLKKRYFNNSL